MAVLIHVTIALSSLLFSTYALFSPSENKMKVNYALIAATVASGTYLIYTMPSHMISACFSGLTYLAVALVLTFATRRRLALKRRINK